MLDIGIRLQLLIGPTIPLPASYDVVDALAELEVTNQDAERDGFRMTFTLGKTSRLNYALLAGVLDPPSRVIVMVIIGAQPQVLIDGIITHHQIQPSNRPGDTRLIVMGEDISLQLDLEERKETHSQQSDSDIVTDILTKRYVTYGIQPDVTDTKDKPGEGERIPTQQGTDLRYIRELARRNGHVFYIEPTGVPGISKAYWGKDNRTGESQPALTMNMGAYTNVDRPLTIAFDALGPTSPQVVIVDPITQQSIPVPVPSGFEPSLSSTPASPLRKTQSWDTAGLSMAEAILAALTSSTESADAVTVSGEVDAVRYGRALQARRLVGVRGVGESYDGDYYVKKVTHFLRRGQYRQAFELRREGRGSSSSHVTS